MIAIKSHSYNYYINWTIVNENMKRLLISGYCIDLFGGTELV